MEAQNSPRCRSQSREKGAQALGVGCSVRGTGAQGVDPEGKGHVMLRSYGNLLHLCPGDGVVAPSAVYDSVVSMGRISGLEVEAS
jgi:hypothetical protein